MTSPFRALLIPCALTCLLLAACSPSSAPRDDASSSPEPTMDTGADAPRKVGAADQPPADARAGMACMMSGTLSMMGITQEVQDCMSTSGGMPEADFKSACEGLVGALGGNGSIEYIDTCPTPAQGRCLNIGGSGLDAYYYKRQADDLANLPRSCSALGGRWASAD